MAPVITVILPCSSHEKMDCSPDTPPPADDQENMSSDVVSQPPGVGCLESEGSSMQAEMTEQGRQPASRMSSGLANQFVPLESAEAGLLTTAGKPARRYVRPRVSKSVSKDVSSSARLSSQTGRSTPSGLLTPTGKSSGLFSPPGRSTPTAFLTPKGRSIPTGFLTPTGRSTPSGFLTPTGRSTPTLASLEMSVYKIFSASNKSPLSREWPDFGGQLTTNRDKNSASTRQIHFHNLENVSVLELYPQQTFDTQFPEKPTRTSNLNEFQGKDVVVDGNILHNNNNRRAREYKSRSCPHSRRHSPVRQRNTIETVNEIDNSFEMAANDEVDNEVFGSKDVNFNDSIYINAGVSFSEDSDPKEPHYTVNGSRQSLEDVTFASLFARCRFERDTSATNTPREGTAHAVDPDLLMRRVFLCAERVSQMTRSYDNDIEAVTHLLEEKERDLELAARIGQTLLSKNKDLNCRLEALEDQLNVATDTVSQLQHELTRKDDVIRCYSDALENDFTGDTESRTGLPLATVEFLENKVRNLEDENFSLRQESAQLRVQTESYEEREKKLLENCMHQLDDVNLQVESLARELHDKSEENTHHKEESTKLLTQITDLQKKIAKLTLENINVHEQLAASAETQHRLTRELSQMQDKYDELFEMLEEARGEVRLMKSRDRTYSSGWHSGYAASTDSLASELEVSLHQELSQSMGRSDNWRVFETARAVRKTCARPSLGDRSFESRISLGLTNRWETDSQGPSTYLSDAESITSDGYGVDMEGLYGNNPELGQPGMPGSKDLESALKRMSLRRPSETSGHSFQEEGKRREMQDDMTDGPPFRGLIPHVARSRADSWSSTGTSVSNYRYRLPEKLQIVKPLEGSMTLRQWQHLATPHLGGIFEERDGVQIKGENKIDLTEDICSISDVEDGHSYKSQNDKKQDVGLVHGSMNTTTHSAHIHREEERDLCSSSIHGQFNEHTSISVKDEKNQATTPTSSSESQHQQASWQHRQDINSSTHSPYSNSLGLAALLSGREDPRPAPRRLTASKTDAKLSSALAPSPVMSETALNKTILSSESYESQPLSTSTPKIFVGNRSYDVPVKDVKEKQNSSGTDSGSAQKSDSSTSGLTGGFLQQLKNTGYSLYGMWAGGGKSSQTYPDNNAGGASVAGDGSAAATAETGFSKVAEGSVLGALSSFRRRGMF